MTKAAPARERSRWGQIGLIVFVIVLIAAFFLLGQSMVHHRFFKGSRIDRYGHIKQ